MKKTSKEAYASLDISFKKDSAGAQMIAVILNGLQEDLDHHFVNAFVNPYLSQVPIKETTRAMYRRELKHSKPSDIMKNIERIISVEPSRGNHSRDDS